MLLLIGVSNSTKMGVLMQEALHVSGAGIPEIYKFPLKVCFELKISVKEKVLTISRVQ